MDVQQPGRRPELREFLISRRARVSPAGAGLPAGTDRRRTPGLRREEVAVLAGVSPSWYQWLEQGRDITVSGGVLDAVSRVLRLDDTERRHLYGLAGLNPPPSSAPVDTAYCEELQRLIDSWAPNPAAILDRSWNYVAHNATARLALNIGQADRNCLVAFFRDRAYRAGSGPWERVAPSVVAAFRAAASEHPDNPGFREVVDELSATSPEFRTLWARQDVAAGGVLVKEVEHPTIGRLSFESSQLKLPARPDLTVVLYNPLPGTDTAEKLAHLAAAV
ncbi:helix-turn-helix transcriptional regulator [Kitasatospora sp. NPDC058170]|uniref:helix-turn-helix transcriptional regulator n=1 Tax=Kitasatospora sp. NPDC058170 TaxID=3346364 RepID=UPI0036DB319C